VHHAAKNILEEIVGVFRYEYDEENWPALKRMKEGRRALRARAMWRPGSQTAPWIGNCPMIEAVTIARSS